MICQPDYAKALLEKYLAGVATPAELVEVRAAWDVYADEELSAMIEDILPGLPPGSIGEELEKWEPAAKDISRRLRKARRLRIKEWVIDFFKGIMILLIVAVASAGLGKLTNNFAKATCGGLREDSESPTEVYSARLTLSNNDIMSIDSGYSGKVITQGNTDIVKLESGILAYQKHSPVNDSSDLLMYNTITTNKGQHRIILPDGSKVRLNAGSSIRFPVAFLPDKRMVEIEGEAFFEIVANKDAPFYALIKNENNAVVKVLGSDFTIKTYQHGAYVTPIKGNLLLRRVMDSVEVKPGQQAFIRTSRQKTKMRDRIVVYDKVDTDVIVSWTKAMRLYNQAPMKEFVTDMGRWYNLEIMNLSCVANGSISARICYATPLEAILKIFRETGLVFKQEGNRIIFCKPEAPAVRFKQGLVMLNLRKLKVIFTQRRSEENAKSAT